MHVYLEVVISLIGLYIVFSVINSIVLEWIGTRINARGRYLKGKLFNFLNNEKDRETFTQGVKKIISADNRRTETDKFQSDAPTLGQRIYGHPLIKSFFKSPIRWPSKIDPEVFSEAMVSILDPVIESFQKGGKVDFKAPGLDAIIPQSIQDQVEVSLKKAMEDNGQKIKTVQEDLQELFDRYMLSVSQWYKRRLRIWLFVVGTAWAFIFNIDTINIFNKFLLDGDLRREYYSYAQQIDVNRDQLLSDSLKVQASEILDQAAANKISKDSTLQQLTQLILTEGGKKPDVRVSRLGIGLGKYRFSWSSFLGVLFTGIALSFGSTFWFDALRKLLQFGKP